MSDPHVAKLHYSIRHGDHIDYRTTKPVEFEAPDFTARTDGPKLTIEMRTHCPTIEEARAVVEPLLRVWERDTSLSYGPNSLQFDYENADVIERNPIPAQHVMFVEAVGLTKFPRPPNNLARNSTVDRMYSRYSLYRRGGTTLADAAYYCLTCLAEGEERSVVSKQLSLSPDIFKHLGRLSGTKGGMHARKASAASHDFTPHEKQWLETVMVRLIRRAAEVAHDPFADYPLISMAELPPLGDGS